MDAQFLAQGEKMKYYYLGAGLSIAILLNSINVQAGQVEISSMEKPSGWYIGAEGGWTAMESPQSGPASSPLVRSLSEYFSSGYNVGARTGYQWKWLRFEEEFRYQTNPINSIRDGVPQMTVPAHGSRDAYALMTNAIYDFIFGKPVTPHIGIGIGAVGQRDVWSVAAGRCDDSTQWQFGYQAIVGLRFNFTPMIAMDIDYRYLGTTNPTFTFNGGGTGNAVLGTTFTSGYATNSIVASLSVRL
jgi:opacity protein-like surface antigen